MFSRFGDLILRAVSPRDKLMATFSRLQGPICLTDRIIPTAIQHSNTAFIDFSILDSQTFHGNAAEIVCEMSAWCNRLKKTYDKFAMKR